MEESSGIIEQRYTRWQLTGLLLGVHVFLFILLMPTPEGMTAAAQKTAAVCALMVVWWITEAIPIPATALLPLALFPILKIIPMGRVASSYGDKNIFLFMGGFFMAVTMEKWNLHRRIALRIINFLGSSPRQMILGFMIATAFLSMWISNTATTMMMLPIGTAIIFQFEKFWQTREGGQIDFADFSQAMMLAIAYAASIGGIATLIGTPPNIIFIASLKKLFPEAPEISFLQWLTVGLPLVIIFLPITWFYLTHVAFKIKGLSLSIGKEVIQSEIQKLGKRSRAENLTLVYFCLLAFGWIFRGDLNFGFLKISGWANLLGIKDYIHDSTVAIFIAMLLFITPVDFKKGKFLLDWKSAVRIPWGILILFGGGIALADGFGQTKLAQWIASHLVTLQYLPYLIILFVVALSINLLTEITSNTAIATTFMPILAAVSVAMKANPIPLMMAGAIASSLAFMLPVATPPNAIIFGSGYVRLPTMAKVGFGLDIIGAILVLIIIYIVAIPVLHLNIGGLPAWAQ